MLHESFDEEQRFVLVKKHVCGIIFLGLTTDITTSHHIVEFGNQPLYITLITLHATSDRKWKNWGGRVSMLRACAAENASSLHIRKFQKREEK